MKVELGVPRGSSISNVLSEVQSYRLNIGGLNSMRDCVVQLFLVRSVLYQRSQKLSRFGVQSYRPKDEDNHSTVIQLGREYIKCK